MPATEAKSALPSYDEEEAPLFFSEWLKRRRKELDLTQEQLAQRACCSVFAIRKIETGDRRPSQQLAELLAQALEIPIEDQKTFVKVARGFLSLERLPAYVRTASPDGKPRAVPGSLPKMLTPFLGREPELATLDQLLKDPQCSLLTIFGWGGIGKTRLAVETAERATDLFPDGAWFVPLAALNAPAQIVPAIAGALKFKFQEPTNLPGQLIHFLREKKALLVLDNAEHLLDGAGVLTEILAGCQGVKLLVTSRERLNLLSEWVFEIKGLPVPADEHVEQFEAFSSVALFLQSARRVQASYASRPEDYPWILKICKILEGMPLGIELAAAWVGVLSCEAIFQEIRHNLDFLSTSLRDLPERHRSLRATLDHSWNLLTAEERLALSRMAVFRGSFSREAAQQVCGASLAVLSALRNKSLLYRTEQELYSLHEIVHQYAGLKLAEDPHEHARVKDQHGWYYVQCLADWERALQSSRQLETFNAMEAVIDNLALGWQHMIQSCRPGHGVNLEDCAQRLHSALFSLSLFYEMRCRSIEAQTVFQESLASLKSVQGEFERTGDQDRFLSILGHVTAYLGLHHYYTLEYDRSREYLEEALQLLEKSQAWVEKAQVEVMLASIYGMQGKLEKSAALLERCRELFRENDVGWWYLLSTTHLATMMVNLGRMQECEALFQEGFKLLDPGDLRVGLPFRIGYAYVMIGKDPDRAEQLLRENLQLSYEFGNQRITANILLNLGRAALAAQRVDQAVEYIQKSIQRMQEVDESPDLSVHLLYLGKCFIARGELLAAREQFRQILQLEQAIKRVHLVYWVLVHTARLDLEAGQVGKALEAVRVLRRCPIEYPRIQKDLGDLLAGVRAALPPEQVEAAMHLGAAGDFTQEAAGAEVFAFAQAYLNE